MTTTSAVVKILYTKGSSAPCKPLEALYTSLFNAGSIERPFTWTPIRSLENTWLRCVGVATISVIKLYAKKGTERCGYTNIIV